MPTLKLTKSIVDSAMPQAKDIELRDRIVPGFMLKVTPAGRKVFMVSYRTPGGQRRKPAIGRHGELTVEQARALAQVWLAEVRRGNDPFAKRLAAREAPTIAQLCARFLSEYSEPRNRPSTVAANRRLASAHVVPSLGGLKVTEVSRADIGRLMGRLQGTPSSANHVLCFLRKMFNMAEVWGLRPDGSNPCRHVPRYPERGRTRLITDVELQKLFAYLDRADAEGLESRFLTLGIRLQFAFAARRSEIVTLRWAWIDFVNRRVVWPDSKTGGMSKPLGSEALQLLQNAPRLEGSPFVLPCLRNPSWHMTDIAYSEGWGRVLQRAGVTHCGTHAIRHRAATDIANSGVPVKIGMALTAHKTVSMFMRYVHTEDEPIRAAAEAVAERRKRILGR
jgi:integrase